MAVDPHRDKIVLHLAGGIQDFSPTPHAITVGAGVTVQTAVHKGYGSAIQFSGAAAGGVEVPGADFLFAARPWSFSAWIRPTTLSGSGQYRGIATVRTSNTAQHAWSISMLQNNGGLLFEGANGAISIVYPYQFVIGQWVFISLSVDAGRVYIGVNGTVQSYPVSTLGTSNQPLRIGRLDAGTSSAGYAFAGQMSDVMITRDVARFTEGFAPPDFPLLDITRVNPLPVGSAIGGKVNINSPAGPPAERVLIIEADSGETYTISTPHSDGNWGAYVPDGDYYLTYLNPGCQPVTHGPYHVEVGQPVQPANLLAPLIILP